MTPADRLALARKLLEAASDMVSSARYEAVAVRPELEAELKVLERSAERLAAAERRLLKAGWGKTIRRMQSGPT